MRETFVHQSPEYIVQIHLDLAQRWRLTTILEDVSLHCILLRALIIACSAQFHDCFVLPAAIFELKVQISNWKLEFKMIKFSYQFPSLLQQHCTNNIPVFEVRTIHFVLE